MSSLRPFRFSMTSFFLLYEKKTPPQPYLSNLMINFLFIPFRLVYRKESIFPSNHGSNPNRSFFSVRLLNDFGYKALVFFGIAIYVTTERITRIFTLLYTLQYWVHGAYNVDFSWFWNGFLNKYFAPHLPFGLIFLGPAHMNAPSINCAKRGKTLICARLC